jgi:hypothetical protein
MLTMDDVRQRQKGMDGSSCCDASTTGCVQMHASSVSFWCRRLAPSSSTTTLLMNRKGRVDRYATDADGIVSMMVVAVWWQCRSSSSP